MKRFWLQLFRQEVGAVPLLIVLSFVALAVPFVTSSVSLAGTLSKDSLIKTQILKSQYSSQGCTQHAAYRLNNEAGYADSLDIGVPDVYSFDGCTISVTKVSVTQASEVAYADLAMVLDVSGSVDHNELADLKQAANEIVDAFSLGTTDSRIAIGVTRFRGSYEVVQGMTDVEQPLHDAINGLQQGGPGLDSGTNIVAGLNGGAATFASGQGDRVDPPYPVPNLMIFITDGDDSEGNSDSEIEDASLATGAEVFAIGVGSDVQIDTINAIATDPDGDHAFTTADYSALLDLIDDLVAEVYDAAAVGTLFIIEAVSGDGTVVVSKVLIPPA